MSPTPFLNRGLIEFIVVAFIALLIFGEHLPSVMRALGGPWTRPKP
jgi:Sec-independent protein translocase protein TatA